MHQHNYVSIATYILLINLIIIYLYIYIYITVRIKLLLMPILSKILKEQYNVDLKYIKLYCKYIINIGNHMSTLKTKAFLKINQIGTT